MPLNCGNPEIGRGFSLAWESYGSVKSAVVVFFVMRDETNISDHKTLEYNIYECNPDILVRRKIYDDVLDSVHTDEHGTLFV